MNKAAVPGMLTLLGAGGLGLVGYNSLYTVKSGQKAIIFNRIGGLSDRIIDEGMHFRIPWFQIPYVYNTRVQAKKISSLTGSKDLQMVNLTVRVLSKPDSKQLPWIYTRLGTKQDEVVLPGIVNEICKQVVAQFNAAQLLTQREKVSMMIRQALKERLTYFHILLDDVSIIDLQFGREFMHAVEQKQVAQQDAERAKFLVEKAQQDKRAIIIKAQGEAKAAELIGQAISKNPGFVELRRIDTARQIADVLARSSNRAYLDANSLMLTVGDADKISSSINA
eukprot:snap_masked-scaffold_45-processed-gene-1.29-mRNA-1 protein AED:0.05 eAED:0.05 QI:0/-1/0/1/-1/1/1/0/279